MEEDGDDQAEDDSDSESGSDDDGSVSSGSSFDSDATSDLDDSDSSVSSTESGPQHEQMDAENETVSPDLEYAVIAHRKKGLLLSRLSEVSVRGTLSVIDMARRGLGVNDVALIEQVILGNPRLSVLKLGYNDLGDVGAHCIANALCIEADGKLDHRALAVLDLCFNGIGDDGCGGLAMKAIAGNYHLRTLFLTGNNIGEKGALSIAGALVHGCYLSRLHLTANKIGPEGTKALATAVAEVDARLQMQEAAGVAVQSPFLHRMEHLFLGSTRMEATGFYTIPSMLLSNVSLKVLCLTDNNLQDSDISILAQALTQNKNVPLESLMLSHNQITCAGVESLMNSIWGSPTLREMKLDNNKMQDRGAQLCAVVLGSVSLEKLDISFNSVTTVGVRALMKSLSEDTNMRSLGICGIPIDLNAAKAVSFALAYNTGLEIVYMDNCQVGYSAQRHITAGIVSNQKAPLQQLTGFPMGPITATLGMPQVPEDWNNEKVLGFVRLMWRNWGKKRGPADQGEAEEAKGPAPPAAVAAAAKIALASLGSDPSAELYVEPRKIETYNDVENSDVSPLVPSNAALIERTFSGRCLVASVSDTEGGDQNGFLEAWSESSAFGRPANVSYAVTGASYHDAPLDNPEQRNRNLRWLRTHFRPLIDVGKLPFNNADMWQLHQYYFSPPYYGDDDNDSKTPAVDHDEKKVHSSGVRTPPVVARKRSTKDRAAAPPTTPVSSSSQQQPNMGKAISFQALSSAVAAADLTNGSHKRRGEDGMEEETKTSKETEHLKANEKHEASNCLLPQNQSQIGIPWNKTTGADIIIA
ncbi:Ribonuclease inhibitor [Seminavis robusta]|uniref:Ribonuclease inhibitor n=1 Tax=Seminavis robusta TaxID=568900 RepID=A0A9N8H882_9STRA|nr:Ribonuclease inhibitor [Seminavis robusta]|eukprot:Sro152_g069440.1 Ribonuclease inhibitor (811) ;mRNA; r:42614-45288